MRRLAETANVIRSWWSCWRGRHLEPLLPNGDSVMQWEECLRCGAQFDYRERAAPRRPRDPRRPCGS